MEKKEKAFKLFVLILFVVSGYIGPFMMGLWIGGVINIWGYILSIFIAGVFTSFPLIAFWKESIDEIFNQDHP
jgi:hypothetical protein